LEDLQQAYDDLIEQQKWLMAILSVIIEEQGGLVKIDQKTLEEYNVYGRVSVWRDPTDNSYMVAVGEIE
jgi:hypothetical protein